MVSLLLFLLVILVYVSNGRTVGSGDTLPARYLPFSFLRALDANLDEFPVLHDETARRTFPLLDGVPYFLHYREGHYLSAYSPGPALVAVPVYAWAVLAGASAEAWASQLEKLSAAAIVALSVVCLFQALTGLVERRWALGIAAVYAFGTSSWSVSSQALWQHGPSQLFLALLLLCLVRGRDDERWLACAGLAASAAAVMRATDALVVIPVIAWVVRHARPRVTFRLVLFALPPLIGVALYYVWYFGSIAGPGGSTTAPTWALFSRRLSLEGLWGVLSSPGRGLFVYSPVLAFAVVGLARALVRGPRLLGSLALGVPMVVVVTGQWFRWWGGYTWGPRLLADITPVLCFFLYPLTDVLDRHRVVKALFVLLAALSMAVHGLGAFVYDARWDALVDVDRNDTALWSWKDGPLAFYGREVASTVGRVFATRRGGETSADAPTGLAASYEVPSIPSEAFVGETLAVSFRARNTGRTVWLSSAPGDRGTVRLGWRWSRDGVRVTEGRAPLSVDVWPGQLARFAGRVSVPAVPGDYTLTLDLVSELVTWFGDQGQASVTVPVKARPLDLERVLSAPVRTDGRSPTATISTDRASYRRGDTIRLTVDLRNPARPGQFDAYLVVQGPGAGVWSYDGRQLFRRADDAWMAWCRQLPFPARATGRFALGSSTFGPGAYRWHVVLTESETYRVVARGSAAFTIEP